MARLAIICTLFAGLLSLMGCSQSTSPSNTGTSKLPDFSADEIAEKRKQLKQALVNSDEDVRTPFATGLAPLNSLVVIPQWGLPETAADALARIGPTAVPSLMVALKDSDPQVRMRAAQAFARMGPEASEAVPALTRALNDPDVDVRRYAARALGQIGPAAESAIPALVTAMSQPSEDEKFDVPTVVVPMPGKNTPAR